MVDQPAFTDEGGRRVEYRESEQKIDDEAEVQIARTSAGVQSALSSST